MKSNILNEAETKEYCELFFNGRLNSMSACYKEAVEKAKKENNVKQLSLFKKQLQVINKLMEAK